MLAITSEMITAIIIYAIMAATLLLDFTPGDASVFSTGALVSEVFPSIFNFSHIYMYEYC